MKTQFRNLFSVGLLCLSLFTAGASHAGQFNTVLSIGDKMPTFDNLPNIDGRSLSSSDIDGDVIVMMSLANHCPWVRGMDGDLVKLAKQFEDQSVTIVGVSVNLRDDDRLEAMKVHAKENGYKFHYVFDETQELGRKLGAARTPEYFVFDQDRRLAYTGLLHNSPAMQQRSGKVKYTKGDPTEFYVQDAINAVLAGRTPTVQETEARGCSVKYQENEDD